MAVDLLVRNQSRQPGKVEDWLRGYVVSVGEVGAFAGSGVVDDPEFAIVRITDATDVNTARALYLEEDWETNEEGENVRLIRRRTKALDLDAIEVRVISGAAELPLPGQRVRMPGHRPAQPARVTRSSSLDSVGRESTEEGVDREMTVEEVLAITVDVPVVP